MSQKEIKVMSLGTGTAAGSQEETGCSFQGKNEE